MKPILFTVPNSHLYPGLIGHVGAEPSTQIGTVLASLVFANGEMTGGKLRCVGGTWLLDVDRYFTAKGAAVLAKTWVVSFANVGARIEFKILRRRWQEGEATQCS